MKVNEKRVLIGYCILLIIGLLMFFTDYTFHFKICNYILWAIIIIYPVFQFFKRIKPLALSIAAAIILTSGVGYFAFDALFFYAFASSGTTNSIQEWEIDNFEIKYLRQQDWAGPSYKKYVLNHYLFGKVLKKTIAHNIPKKNELNDCIIRLKGYKSIKVFEFDKCEIDLKIYSN